MRFSDLKQPFHTRLAPTPSGYLHRGNALSFVLTWVLARRTGGRLRLRIDDVDRGRYRPNYVEDVFESLAWLGLDYEEGPRSLLDFEQHHAQIHRFGAYLALLERLKDLGLLYACRASRKDLAENGGVSPHRDGRLPFETEDAAWRLRLPEDWEASWCEADGVWRRLRPAEFMADPVLRRRDGLPAYHLASIWEDEAAGMTGIVRGEDLLPSTALQLYLAEVLDLRNFQQVLFWHHPLVVDASGHKLSKSEGAEALRTWREWGRGPLEIWQQAARLLGLGHSVGELRDLLV